MTVITLQQNYIISDDKEYCERCFYKEPLFNTLNFNAYYGCKIFHKELQRSGNYHIKCDECKKACEKTETKQEEPTVGGYIIPKLLWDKISEEDQQYFIAEIKKLKQISLVTF